MLYVSMKNVLFLPLFSIGIINFHKINEFLADVLLLEIFIVKKL